MLRRDLNGLIEVGAVDHVIARDPFRCRTVTRMHHTTSTRGGAAAGLEEELGAVHGAIIGELRASGEFIDTSELDMRAAKIVRTGDGLSVTDGPFAETTE